MANRRIPIELKIIRGTDQPCRRKNEPKYEKLIQSPKPPVYLTRYGRYMWKKLVPMLIKRGLLAAAFLPTLEVLCETYALYREAHETVYGSGKGRQTLSKYLKAGDTTAYRIMKGAFQDFRLYLLEFGLSPSSKSGIDSPEPVKSEDVIERMWNKRHG